MLIPKNLGSGAKCAPSKSYSSQVGVSCTPTGLKLTVCNLEFLLLGSGADLELNLDSHIFQAKALPKLQPQAGLELLTVLPPPPTF